MEAMMEHQGADDERFEAVAGILEQLIAKAEAVDQRLGKLESLVMDEIVGGITNLYNENLRFENIGALKKRYGETFGDLEGSFKDLYDADLWEKLQDLLDELKGGEGYTDEIGDSKVKEIADQLRAKLAKLKGEQPAAAVEVEVKKEVPAELEAKAEDEDPMRPVVERIRKMKSKGRVPGIVGDVA